MSVSFNLKGSDWAAEKQQNCSGEEAEYWSKLENYSKKKLWHQMTNVRNLINLGDHKIKHFSCVRDFSMHGNLRIKHV